MSIISKIGNFSYRLNRDLFIFYNKNVFILRGVFPVIKRLATVAIWFLGCVGAVCVSLSVKDTMRSLATKKGLETGVAVAVGDLSKDSHKNIILENSSIIVAENCMKWQYIHPRENTWNWKDTDRLVEFAEENGISVKFHTLFWHNQNSSFLSEKWSRDKALSVMDNHISTIMELETDTVNRNALLFQFLYKIEHGISFSLSHRFIGIIIKEKLCRRVALMGFCKGVLNVVFSNCFKPDCFPQRAVVLKSFVYNVVFFDSALIALHNR